MIIDKMMTAVTMKTPASPLPITGRTFKNASTLIFITDPPYTNAETRLIMIPPAMTEAICPDTLTPMECIKRKF